VKLNSRAVGIILGLVLPLGGCSGVLDPQGPVGASINLILLDSTAVMLAIVIPVILATLGVAYWFRAGNEKAAYWPEWAFSGRLELITWAIPALVITFLGGIAWFGSHELDPFRPLDSPGRPIEIQVVSLDWKWLFLYPEEGVGSLNELVVPVGRPLHFRLTSNGVMNSFFVPQLGSQIYTMSGMTSQLNLQADKAGTYRGLSAQFSGAGFSSMHFNVKAVPAEDYASWVVSTRGGNAPLDNAAYAKLSAQSENDPPRTFASVDPKLFDAIVAQKAPPAVGPIVTPGGEDAPAPTGVQ
jgi:cytochrome o ubiquinol oxidase subunit II